MFHYHNVTPSEAWELSHQDRVRYINNLKEITDAQREAAGQAKILRASDVESRK